MHHNSLERIDQRLGLMMVEIHTALKQLVMRVLLKNGVETSKDSCNGNLRIR